MAKRTKLSPTFPQEIILQIAQFIPDAASFFAYIEAFHGSTSDQGPLEAVWRLQCLGQSTPQAQLWPSLQLYPTGGEKWTFAIQAIPAYATVKMHAQYDLHRLVGRVRPSTKLVVIHQDKPDPRRMRKWFRHLAQLPVRGLIYNPMGLVDFVDRMPDVISHLCNVWPSLTYLRSLDLEVGDQASFESIWTSVATSQITDLSLRGQLGIKVQLKGVAWTDLVAWLHSARAVRFELKKFRVICDDNDDLMQALNRALAGSVAMQRIVWADCDIRISSPLVLPPRLKELWLPLCTFELVGIDWKLLPTLPHLTEVRLHRTPMSPSDVDVLASVLAQSNVSYLDLGNCSIGVSGHCDESIQRLADAFEATASLRSLKLSNNALGAKAVKAVLAAVERRPYVTELVDLSSN